MHRSEQVNQTFLDELVQTVFSLKNEEECRDFLRDLCTTQELIQLSQRLQVAKLLAAGETYDAISARLPVSSATITRVNTALSYGSGGYRTALLRRAERGETPEA